MTRLSLAGAGCGVGLALVACGSSLQTGATEPPPVPAPVASSAVSAVVSSEPASGVSASAAPTAPAGAASASAVAPMEPPVMTTMALPGGEMAFLGPSRAGAERLTVYLHGMCATGPLECPVFAAASGASWLVCPDGPARCDGFGALWSGSPGAVAAQIERAAALLTERTGAALAGPRALIGYSLGAPAALVQVLRQPGRYDRLMLVNASVEPSAQQLQKAGITRIALVTGERDATAGKLRLAATRLARAGMEARYFALPATGHYFDAASAERMREPIGWLLEATP